MCSVCRVDEHGVALVERAALGILSREAHGIAVEEHGTESQCFRKAVVDGALAVAHFRALFEELGDFRMNVKTLGHAHKAIGNFGKFLGREPGIDFIGAVVAAMLIWRPVVGQFAELRNLSYSAGFGLLFFVFLADGVGYQG